MSEHFQPEKEKNWFCIQSVYVQANQKNLTKISKRQRNILFYNIYLNLMLNLYEKVC